MPRLTALGKKAMGLGFYTADKTQDELTYLFGLMALQSLSERYNPVKPVPYPVKYGGHKWAYHAFKKGSCGVGGLSINTNLCLGSKYPCTYVICSLGAFKAKELLPEHKVQICAVRMSRATARRPRK